MGSIIYIDEKNKLDASAAANTFANKDIKNRAYINTLGAELAMKYLASENINIKNILSIHSIKKILEEFDIADVILPNIHIDVRVIFDEKLIFIPKSHFEYNLVPDIYVVFNLAKDFSSVDFLGFFEPKLINKNNENKDYYFIEKEKLSSPFDLKSFIENSSRDEKISDSELEDSEKFVLSLCDDEISKKDKKNLLKLLVKSSELREKCIEYENFENLSAKAMSSSEIVKKEIPLKNELEEVLPDDFNYITDNLNEELSSESEDETENLETLEETDEVDEISESDEAEEFEQTEEEFQEDELPFLEEDNNEVENLESSTDEQEEDFQEEIETISDETYVEEDSVLEETEEIEPLELEDTQNIEENPIEEEILSTYKEISEYEEEENQGFGNALLENLNEEEHEKYSEYASQINDEVSSEELLNKIDDLISGTYTSQENYQENEENSTEVETEEISDAEPVLESDYSDDDDTEEESIQDYDNSEQEPVETDERLEVLFNDTDTDSDSDTISEIEKITEENIQETTQYQKTLTKPDKKSLLVAVSLAAVLAIVSSVAFLKPKNEDVEAFTPTNDVNTNENILNAPIENNTPVDTNIPTADIPRESIDRQIQELKNNPSQASKPLSSESFIDVKRIVWEVPDSLSYSQKMQNYLRTSGKSIKTTLSADLLMATEYAYTNKIKVNLLMTRDGSIQTAAIASSSGSNQIDAIVLQCVKDTLNVIKPPSSEIRTENFNLSLTIYL